MGRAFRRAFVAASRQCLPPDPQPHPLAAAKGQNVELALSPSGFDCSRESAWSLDFGDWANPT